MVLYEAVCPDGRVVARGSKVFCETEAAWQQRALGVLVVVQRRY